MRTEEQKRAARRATKAKHFLLGWREVARYQSDSSRAVHLVERNGEQYRCSCQAFRIFKRGFCKHTDCARLTIK